MVDLEGLAKRGSAEASLLKRIDPERLPRHVAVIMDGNGRWAGRRNLPRVAGHRAGLQVLTLYAFSVENWKRPRSEIRTLMSLLKKYVRAELENIHKNNIRFQTIGRIQELEPSVQRELEHAVCKTRENTGMILNVALNYGGRAELVDTFNRLHAELDHNGHRTPISEETISRFLYTSGIPDPDLLIRTSGEMRISNFLLWQIAYCEIWITPTYWPDFRRKHLFEAILEYQKRERRYGGI